MEDGRMSAVYHVGVYHEPQQVAISGTRNALCTETTHNLKSLRSLPPQEARPSTPCFSPRGGGGRET